MSKNEITAVGIDVSKGKSTVAVRRPGGEIVMMPFVVLHTAEDLAELTNTLRSIGGEIRVVASHSYILLTAASVHTMRSITKTQICKMASFAGPFVMPAFERKV